jgi:hypothetical protein
MTDAPTSPALLPSCPADEADWARAYAMRQLQMLGELAEIGLDVARAVERQASGSGQESGMPAAPAVFQGDLALAYSRVSRAVRLTLMLQSKLIEDLKAADKAGAEVDAEAAKDEARSDPAYQKKVRVEAIVERVIRAERPDDAETLDTLMTDACERLDDEDVYGDLMERPVSELVARICKDLGLTPDWAELAEELWAVREVQSGRPGWPLAQQALPTERQRLKEALAVLNEAAPLSDTG